MHYIDVLKELQNAKGSNAKKEILKANMDKLTSVATVLLEKEKIDGEEFDEIFND